MVQVFLQNVWLGNYNSDFTASLVIPPYVHRFSFFHKHDTELNAHLYWLLTHTSEHESVPLF